MYVIPKCSYRKTVRLFVEIDVEVVSVTVMSDETAMNFVEDKLREVFEKEGLIDKYSIEDVRTVGRI